MEMAELYSVQSEGIKTVYNNVQTALKQPLIPTISCQKPSSKPGKELANSQGE